MCIKLNKPKRISVVKAPTYPGAWSLIVGGSVRPFAIVARHKSSTHSGNSTVSVPNVNRGDVIDVSMTWPAGQDTSVEITYAWERNPISFFTSDGEEANCWEWLGKTGETKELVVAFK